MISTQYNSIPSMLINNSVSKESQQDKSKSSVWSKDAKATFVMVGAGAVLMGAAVAAVAYRYGFSTDVILSGLQTDAASLKNFITPSDEFRSTLLPNLKSRAQSYLDAASAQAFEGLEVAGDFARQTLTPLNSYVESIRDQVNQFDILQIVDKTQRVVFDALFQKGIEHTPSEIFTNAAGIDASGICEIELDSFSNYLNP